MAIENITCSSTPWENGSLQRAGALGAQEQRLICMGKFTELTVPASLADRVIPAELFMRAYARSHGSKIYQFKNTKTVIAKDFTPHIQQVLSTHLINLRWVQDYIDLQKLAVYTHLHFFFAEGISLIDKIFLEPVWTGDGTTFMARVPGTWWLPRGKCYQPAQSHGLKSNLAFFQTVEKSKAFLLALSPGTNIFKYFKARSNSLTFVCLELAKRSRMSSTVGVASMGLVVQACSWEGVCIPSRLAAIPLGAKARAHGHSRFTVLTIFICNIRSINDILLQATIEQGKLSAKTVKGTRNAAVLETGFCRIGKGFSHAEEKLVLVLLYILYTDVENGNTYAHGLLTFNFQGTNKEEVLENNAKRVVSEHKKNCNKESEEIPPATTPLCTVHPEWRQSDHLPERSQSKKRKLRARQEVPRAGLLKQARRSCMQGSPFCSRSSPWVPALQSPGDVSQAAALRGCPSKEAPGKPSIQKTTGKQMKTYNQGLKRDWKETEVSVHCLFPFQKTLATPHPTIGLMTKRKPVPAGRSSKKPFASAIGIRLKISNHTATWCIHEGVTQPAEVACPSSPVLGFPMSPCSLNSATPVTTTRPSTTSSQDFLFWSM
ncbi:hypothetical protein Anapl_06246 [Anas platyrhynchos]|uniref:Uncharacterized protein n=1 Tax=Anas platyrhynchos TaxID=8839 RepID=R0L9W6_ANAPL|nr:hypothetical protein Anapl_06246 [Anas platyrhynchos]